MSGFREQPLDRSSGVFEFVDDYRGNRISRRRPGFEFTPMLLGKIACMVVSPPVGPPTICAFMYPFFESGQPLEVDEQRVAEEALATVRTMIDSGLGDAGGQTTHEWTQGEWREVHSPHWWVPVPESRD